jgi:hypothetical protein
MPSSSPFDVDAAAVVSLPATVVSVDASSLPQALATRASPMASAATRRTVDFFMCIPLYSFVVATQELPLGKWV